MSRNRWAFNASGLAHAIRGFTQATGFTRDEILVRLNQREGTAEICARAPGDPPGKEPPLEAGKEIVL